MSDLKLVIKFDMVNKEELDKLSAITPFEFDDLANADVALKTFGVEVELQKVIEFAMHLGISVSEAAVMIGRVLTASR